MARTISAETIPKLREKDISTVLERPSYQAYEVLHVGCSLIFLLMGADKYLNLFTDWSKYYSSGLLDYIPLTTGRLIATIGLLEIVAGVLIALVPRIGGYIAAAWLWVVIANLVLLGNYFEVGLLNLGFSLGAVSLARLAGEIERAGN